MTMMHGITPMGTDLGERDGWKIEDDGNAPDVEENERKARKEPGREIEALFKVLVGAGDIEAAEVGQVKGDDEWHDEENRQLSDVERGVLRVGLRGDGHEGDGAEHGGEDAQAGHPPGDALTAPEEVVRAPSPSGEPDADSHHPSEIGGYHRPVHKAEGLRRGLYLGAQHLGRSDARFDSPLSEGPGVQARLPPAWSPELVRAFLRIPPTCS